MIVFLKIIFRPVCVVLYPRFFSREKGGNGGKKPTWSVGSWPLEKIKSSATPSLPRALNQNDLSHLPIKSKHKMLSPWLLLSGKIN